MEGSENDARFHSWATHLNFIQRSARTFDRSAFLSVRNLSFRTFFLLRSCFESAFRTTINFHGAKSISGLFLSCERGEVRKKLKRREREKKGKTFLKYFAECWQMQRVKSVMLDFSLLESWLGIRAKISRQKWLNIVQRAPCLVTKQPVADSATIF